MKNKNDKWNLKPLLKSDNDPEANNKRKVLLKESNKFVKKWKNRNDYLKQPAILKIALDEYEKWQRLYGIWGDEGYYFMLRMQQDQTNPAIRAKFNKIQEFGIKIANEIEFFELRIGKIDKITQKEILSDKKLGKYKHFLEKIFDTSKYNLSEAEERIMNLKSATSHSNWEEMVSSLLSKEEREVYFETEKRVKKHLPEMFTLLSSKKKKVRDSSAKAINEILEKISSVAEFEINSILANKKVNDELRGAKRPDLFRHLGDDINSDIVDTLIESVSKRFDISQKYYKFKAKLLKLKKLEYHERNIDYGKIEKEYSYEKSFKIISSVFKKIDEEFSQIVNNFSKNKQVDVYPRKGKTSGAFCAHGQLSQPTYILLNHTDKLTDVLTIAHEFGHGINNELMRKQNSLNFGSSTATAEVASTFMEDFVLENILKNSNDELKLAIMTKKLDSDISTIFRQIACYKFEQELHQNFRASGHLSREEIGKLFQKHMKSYMGNSVIQSPGSENWWIYWSHIRSFFYVYSYASGLLISKSLQNSFKKDSRFIEKIKYFLSAGCSESPKNIFSNIGIDISKNSFWNQGISETEKLLNDTIKLAKILKKI
ncbi:MAG: M3 family oligoendopeptidase [Patescibacteria group bacterium]|nr:M3 family oligoendopeptidase [Patescibacteria group bacterium]